MATSTLAAMTSQEQTSAVAAITNTTTTTQADNNMNTSCVLPTAAPSLAAVVKCNDGTVFEDGEMIMAVVAVAAEAEEAEGEEEEEETNCNDDIGAAAAAAAVHHQQQQQQQQQKEETTTVTTTTTMTSIMDSSSSSSSTTKNMEEECNYVKHEGLNTQKSNKTESKVRPKKNVILYIAHGGGEQGTREVVRTWKKSVLSFTNARESLDIGIQKVTLFFFHYLQLIFMAF
jgi:hypothetical protein